MDVHVNRMPVGGRVTRCEDHPGKFLPAYRREAGDLNEYTEVSVDIGGRTVIVRQIVGILARRIVCRVREGDVVAAGDRFGVMKFGSRMDVFLPTGRHAAGAGGGPRGGRHHARSPGCWHGQAAVNEPRDCARRLSMLLADAPAAAIERDGFAARRLPAAEPFTMANMFCGYACIVHAMRGEFDTAAPFIGIAIVLDMLDGRIARMTGTTSEFGLEFDSLADVISFGMAPAMLSFAWGLQPLGRLGWAAGFLFVTAAARASGAVQHPVGQPRQAVLRRACPAHRGGGAGGDGVRVPVGLQRPVGGAAGPGDRDRAGAPDGQHHPVPQLQDARSADPPQLAGAVLLALFLAALAAQPEIVLLVLAYGYLSYGLHRAGLEPLAPAAEATPHDAGEDARGRAARNAQTDSDSSSRGSHEPTAATGNRTSTVVPRSRWLLIPIEPPLSSTLRFAIGSPRPVPRALVEKYGSNTRSSAS